jgi:hypothetical protein
MPIHAGHVPCGVDDYAPGTRTPIAAPQKPLVGVEWAVTREEEAEAVP